ncbi:hypothetical protein FRB99_002129 [Tulasnella sp. 403]|nr:hypothetical protein FRB99_002129 [Tulasnella sp. 403]
MSGDDDVDDFSLLPFRIQQRIDSAFDQAIAEQLPTKKSVIPKGSLRRDAGSVGDNVEGGGFLADSTSDWHEKGIIPQSEDHIPLSLIPRALQILDQPPDNDVLSTFENAASGWGASEEGGVARQDWRAVCAILLGNAASGSEMSAAEADGIEISQKTFHGESTSQYSPTADSRSEGFGTPVRKTDRQDEGPNNRTSLTNRQRRECAAAFSLFFPNVPEDQLLVQRLSVNEVVTAARSLNVKLTQEEVAEMLEAFTTSVEKTMSLHDFEQMMMLAKLV